MASMLSRSIEREPDRVLVVEIIGRIDSDNAVWLTLDVENALAEDRNRVILDLSGVYYMNSAGLRELVQVWKRTQQSGGNLSVVNPSPYVQKLLELVGLDSVLPIYNDPTWNTAMRPSVLAPGVHRYTRYYS
jgi:anti-sigma B factor antagonist